MIIQNSAICFNCKVEIFSKFRHDFQICPCGGVFVDGGFDYIRHGWTDKEQYCNTSIEVG